GGPCTHAGSGRRRARRRRRHRARRGTARLDRGDEDGASGARAARRHGAPAGRGRRPGAAGPARRTRQRTGDSMTDDLSSIGLNEEQRELAAMVRDFAEQVVAPQAYEADRTHTLNLDVVRQMGELGLFGLPFPEEHGGQGGDYLALGLAIEALARVDQSIAITLEAGVSLGAMPIHRFGTEEQKAEYLPSLLAGQQLAGFGLTEPEAGSDAGATRTSARLDDGEWV